MLKITFCKNCSTFKKKEESCGRLLCHQKQKKNYNNFNLNSNWKQKYISFNFFDSSFDLIKAQHTGDSVLIKNVDA